MLTKGLYAERFEKLRDMAGVKEFHLIHSKKECRKSLLVSDSDYLQ